MTTLAALIADTDLVDTLDGKGRPSPIGQPADQITLGTVLTEIQTRLLALEADLLPAAVAVVTAAGGSGGATAGTFSLQLNLPDEVTPIDAPMQVFVVVADVQYAGFADVNANVTFGTATTGTKIASGSGWALFETDATGAVVCPTTNAADETVYFSATTPPGGLSDPTDHGVIVSNSVAATWSV